MKAAKLLKPHIIVVMGDFADCYSVSNHTKGPHQPRYLKEELEVVSTRLAELEALRAHTKVYLMGNHEDRIDRLIDAQAPALSGMVSMSTHLRLWERGWYMVPYKRKTKLGKLNLTHDVGTAGQNAHRDAASAFMSSAAIGHTHRMSYEVRGKLDGTPYLAAMFGWLGDFASIDYMHEVKAAQWAHGFGIGFMEPNGVVHVQPVPIVKGVCVVLGKRVAA